jgi:hypothetical protein
MFTGIYAKSLMLDGCHARLCFHGIPHPAGIAPAHDQYKHDGPTIGTVEERRMASKGIGWHWPIGEESPSALNFRIPPLCSGNRA